MGYESGLVPRNLLSLECDSSDFIYVQVRKCAVLLIVLLQSTSTANARKLNTVNSCFRKLKLREEQIRPFLSSSVHVRGRKQAEKEGTYGPCEDFFQKIEKSLNLEKIFAQLHS